MNPMRSFLTEENIKKHREYLEKLRLRYSVLKKSEPKLNEAGIKDIARLPIKQDIKKEAAELMSDIISHEVYFSSFSKMRTACPELRKKFSSENAFLYELFKMARAERCGFLYIYADRHGGITPVIDKTGEFLHIKRKPLLAVDLFEHAYFSDYGFLREKYIENALAHLDLTKISECMKKD